MENQSASPAPRKSSWLNLAVDYGPVLVFFAVYKYFAPSDDKDTVGLVLAIMKGTGSFMVAAIAALIFSKWRFGHVSPMLWLSTALIVGFGALTIFLHEPVWIQRKPTAVYLLFGVSLLIGVWRRVALLKYLLEAAFEGLSDVGWMILSRNWGYFFFVLAALNEVLRHFYNVEHGNFGVWLAAKLWVFLPLTFLFTFLQIPMLLRHGMADDEVSEVVENPPHE